MAWKTILLASILVTGALPVAASQSHDHDDSTTAGAPDAPEGALYCLKMEPITGTRIGSVLCWTRQEWAENDIDLDKAWAEDGVEVIGG
jgi:hypothetical protein